MFFMRIVVINTISNVTLIKIFNLSPYLITLIIFLNFILYLCVIFRDPITERFKIYNESVNRNLKQKDKLKYK